MKKTKTGRNSSIEMLRIVAMLMIVLSHASIHGGFPDSASKVEFNNHFLNWAILGNLGVNLFLLITGYFFCTKQLQARVLIKQLTQVWFYSILCGIIGVAAKCTLSPKRIITIIFPTIFKSYWFFTAYVVLILLCPYINIFIKNASQKQFQTCILTMFVLWSVILSFTDQDMYGSEIPQFVFYYLIGAYIRTYPKSFLDIPKYRNALAIISLFLLFLSSSAIRFVNETVGYILSETSFTNPFSIITVGAAVGLFSIAAYHKPWENTHINIVASCVFGIYLLHDNILLRDLIWKKWINNAVWYDSPFMSIRMFISVAVIFAVGFAVEFLRQKTVEKPFIEFAEKVYANICSKVDAVKQSLCNRKIQIGEK